MNERAISRRIATSMQVPSHTVAPGFDVSSVRGGLGNLDPLVNIDMFQISQPVFPPHPHGGFSAVTYLFTNSLANITNRDSHGTHTLIKPGGLHWTFAGSGIVHEEIPDVAGQLIFGAQIFINASAEHEMDDPRTIHRTPEQIPEVKPADGVLMRVVVGEAFGAGPAIDQPTEITILDVRIDVDATLSLPLSSTDSATIFVISGGVVIAGEKLEAESAATLGEGELIELVAGSDGAHLLVVYGPRLNEEVHTSGGFIFSTQSGAIDAERRFHSGHMGSLAASF